MDPDVFDPSIPSLLENGCYQVKGMIELAIKNYSSLLGKLSEVQFEGMVVKEMIDGYLDLHDWSGASELLRREAISEEIPMKQQLQRLSVWSESRIAPELTSSLLHDGLEQCMEQIGNDYLNKLKIDGNANEDLMKAVSLGTRRMKEIASAGVLKDHQAVIDPLFYGQSILKVLEGKISDKGKNIKLRKAKPKDRITSDSILGKFLPKWIEAYDLARIFEQSSPTNFRDPDLNEIGGLLANLSRKTQNFGLANRLIEEINATLTTSATLRVKFKKARLLYSEGHLQDACNQLLEALSIKIIGSDPIDVETKAKACSLFTFWSSSLTDEIPRDKIELALGNPLETYLDPPFISNLNQPQGDFIGNAFLSLATSVAPNLSKTWLVWAGFSYAVGRKMLEELSSPSSATYFADHIRKARQILEDNGSSAMFDQYLQSLLGDMGEIAEGKMQAALWRFQLPESAVDELETLLETIRKLVYDQFGVSTKAYFRYLSMSASNSADEITATLRVLRIFNRHGFALEKVFFLSF